MEKLILIIIVCMFILSSCAFNGGRLYSNSETEATKLAEQMVDTIRERDETAFMNLFTETVRDDDRFAQGVEELFKYIKGEVASCDVSEAIGTSTRTDHGEKHQVVEVPLTIVTDEGKYYVAFRACLINTFNSDGVGITSMYIIDADNWKEDCLYRGGDGWTKGINIDIPEQATELGE